MLEKYRDEGSCDGCAYKECKVKSWYYVDPHPCTGCSRAMQRPRDKFTPLNKPLDNQKDI